MGISDSPSRPISRLAVAPEAARGPRQVVRVTMLRDGRGMTSHGRRPVEITPKKGDSLEVSSDLAENWGAAGICEEHAEDAIRLVVEETTVPTVETEKEQSVAPNIIAPEERPKATPKASRKKARKRT